MTGNSAWMQLGWAALHKAAENEDLEMIEYLLDHGADINVRNPVRRGCFLVSSAQRS